LTQRVGQYLPALGRAEYIANRATDRFTDNPALYMNPYTDQVVKRIAEEGGKTFKEHILPAQEAKFVRLGQYGSKNHQKMVARAARDLQNEIMARQAHALHSGYQHAAQLHGLEQNRNLSAAQQIADIGTRRQAGNLADAAALAEQGRYQQAHGQFGRDLAYQNYLREQNIPWDNLMKEAALVQHSQLPTQAVHLEQTPAAPQLTNQAALGSLATQLLGMRMMGRS
jgi:hypothetical protein